MSNLALPFHIMENWTTLLFLWKDLLSDFMRRLAFSASFLNDAFICFRVQTLGEGI